MYHAINKGYKITEMTQNGGVEARVFNVFARALNLVTKEGQLVGILNYQHQGPNNIIVPGLDNSANFIRAGQYALITPELISVPEANFFVNIDNVNVWPKPILPKSPLANMEERQRSVLMAVETTLGLGKDHGFAILLPHLLSKGGGDLGNNTKPNSILEDSVKGSTITHALTCLGLLRKSLVETCPFEKMEKAVQGLVGLGRGLTPQGDDFLTGFILTFIYYSRAINIQSQWVLALTRKVVEAAENRTTKVSEHQIRDAANGEADETTSKAAISMLWGMECLKKRIIDLTHQGSSSGSDLITGICLASEWLHYLTKPRGTI